jgi:hypothetical protein
VVYAHLDWSQEARQRLRLMLAQLDRDELEGVLLLALEQDDPNFAGAVIAATIAGLATQRIMPEVPHASDEIQPR